MRLSRRVLLHVLIFLVLGCQQKTPVYHDVPLAPLNIHNLRQESTMVFDVRSTEEAQRPLLPGATAMRWDDFVGISPLAMAKLVEKLDVSSEKTILVVGRGKQGVGEDGYIAWIFDIFGMQNVYTLSLEFYLKSGFSAIPSAVRKPAGHPEADPNLFIEAVDFRAYVTQTLPQRGWTSKARSRALGGVPLGALYPPPKSFFGMKFPELQHKVLVLDVRSQKEFEGYNLKMEKEVKAPLLHLSWSEFFDDRGLPSASVNNRLAELGVHKNSIVFVISERGVRSGAVAYAMRSLGYQKVVNYLGGYRQWERQ